MTQENFFTSELSKQIWEKKYRHNDESFEDWLRRVTNGNKKIEKLILDKKFIFGGRTLSNRCLDGSLSNCYTIGHVDDSLDDIMDVAKKIALTFKAQGGQGVSLSLIRPKGSVIGGRYKSDGIVPFMEIFDTVAANISQGGARRGALMLSLDITHQEAETFMTIKSDLNKINNANLSLEIRDDFMSMVEDYYKSGIEHKLTVQQEIGNHEIIKYQVVPIKLFKLLCKYAHGYAEPGVMFISEMNRYNLNQHDSKYTINCTNPCGEQPLVDHAACNLCAINLAAYVKNPFGDNVEFDYGGLCKDLPIVYGEMNRVLDEGIEKHSLPEQREAAKHWRNIGIGITGLAELFIMFKTPYGSDKSVELTESIMSFIFRQCLMLNIANGKQFGSFPGFNPQCDYNNTDIVRNAYRKSDTKAPKITHLRNCSMLTIAPTGSISN